MPADEQSDLERFLLERNTRICETRNTSHQNHTSTFIGWLSRRGGDQVLCEGYC